MTTSNADITITRLEARRLIDLLIDNDTTGEIPKSIIDLAEIIDTAQGKADEQAVSITIEILAGQL